MHCNKFHLENWSSLSWPKGWGGWGINDLKIFNLSVCAKILWRAMTNSRLWGTIIKSKYMSRLPLDIWLRRANFKLNIVSTVWRSLLTTLPYIFPGLCWLVGRGNLIYIGLDPIMGISNFTLSHPLLVWLHGRNLVLLKHFFVQNDSLAP